MILHWIVLLIFSTQISKLHAANKSELALKLNAINCVGNPLLTTNVKCNIQRPKNETFSVEVEVTQKLTMISCFMELYTINSGKDNYTKVFSLPFSLCDLLSNGANTKWIKAISRSVLKNSSNPKCPIKGSYYFYNVNLIENLPKMFPSMNFRGGVSCLIPENRHLFNISINLRTYRRFTIIN